MFLKFWAIKKIDPDRKKAGDLRLRGKFQLRVIFEFTYADLLQFTVFVLAGKVY